ncbi:MAG: DUF2283 domain-containing protein [Nitrospirota bacterium]|nr:DUF2283 domain-containing protein [Nitrospirota bacterium]
MKVVYDSDIDTLSLILRKEDIAESDEVREGVFIDYNYESAHPMSIKRYFPVRDNLSCS